MEQSLIQQQQELVELRDNLQTDLIEEQVMNRQIIEYITSYLEENKRIQLQYILGKSFEVVLYKTRLDITDKVTKALNDK